MEHSYKTSSHKWTYIWIAVKHFTTPTRVYQLAHGKQYHKKDLKIMHDLRAYGIMHHSHKHYNEN